MTYCSHSGIWNPAQHNDGRPEAPGYVIRRNLLFCMWTCHNLSSEMTTGFRKVPSPGSYPQPQRKTLILGL